MIFLAIRLHSSRMQNRQIKLESSKIKCNLNDFILQTKSLLGVFQKDAAMLHDYSKGMFQCCQRVITAQVKKLFTKKIKDHWLFKT